MPSFLGAEPDSSGALEMGVLRGQVVRIRVVRMAGSDWMVESIRIIHLNIFIFSY